MRVWRSFNVPYEKMLAVPLSVLQILLSQQFLLILLLITNRSIGYITQYFPSILVRVMWAQREWLCTTAALTLVAIASLDKFLKLQYLLNLKTQRLIAFIGSERKDHIQGFLWARSTPARSSEWNLNGAFLPWQQRPVTWNLYYLHCCSHLLKPMLLIYSFVISS